MWTLINGIGFGLILAVTVGPVFFNLIRTSILKGFKSGVYLALGIALSDIFISTIIFTGISQFTRSFFHQNQSFEATLGVIGSLIMIVFGIILYLQSTTNHKFTPPREHFNDLKGIKFVLEGFILNCINPMVYVVWIVAAGQLIHVPSYQYPLFLLGAIGTMLLFDILKAYLANRITNYLTAHILGMIDKIAGVGLMGFGVRLLVFALYGI
jgi:threonine/homoserine/homoserine lactone efflux protein